MTAEEQRISEEMSRLMGIIESENLNAKEQDAACTALRGLAQTRAELARARELEADRLNRQTQLEAKDILHEGVEVLKIAVPIASCVVTYMIWKDSLKIDQLGEIVTTNVGKNLIRRRM